MSTVAHTCPPLEDIAAFLDGKLSEGERSRVVAHLADCESCYAVFAGAARFQLAEAEEKEEEDSQESAVATAAEVKAPVVIPFHRRPAVRWALPLAAMLLLGLASVRLYFQYSQMPEMVSTQLVDPVALKNVPLDKLWDTMRGTESEGGLNDPAEFLIGAHLVDLRLTLQRDNQESANVMSRINDQMKNLLFTPPEAAFYEKGPGQIQQGVPPRDLLEEAVRTEASLTEFLHNSAHLAFGKWTEAGRLAAIARNPELFEERKNRRFLSWLLRNADEEHVAPEVVAELKEIRGLLDEDDRQERHLKELEVRFGKILDHYQAEARSETPF